MKKSIEQSEHKLSTVFDSVNLFLCRSEQVLVKVIDP